MSTKLIFDAGQASALRNGRVRFTATGAVEKLSGAGATASWVATSASEQKAALNALVKEAQSAPGSLSTNARAWLRDNLTKPEFTGAFGASTTDVAVKDAMTNIKEAISFADSQHGAFDLDGFKRGVLKHGDLAEKLLSPKTIADAEAAGYKLADMAVLRKDAETLKGLLKVVDGKAVDRQAVEKLLIKHHASAPMLIEAAGNTAAGEYFTANHAMNLDGFAAHVQGNVSAMEGEIRNGITTVNAEVQALADLKESKAEQAEIQAAEKRVTEAKSALKKSIASPEGHEAVKLLHADEGFAEDLTKGRSAVSELESAAKKAAAEAKAGAKAAVDAGKSDAKFFSLYHGETKLAEIASKEGKVVSDLGFLKKLRPGKTALVAGAVALGGYAIAGMGNRGPSEKAAEVNRSRENGQAAGIA